MKIVILTGADRSGKSTLADEFIRQGYKYKHFDPPKGSPYGEYLDYAKELAGNGDPDGKYVIDRYMYCEFAYSKHYGRGTDMTIERMREIEDILLSLDPSAAIVYCATSLESNWERIEAEGKREFKDIGQLDALRNEYKRVFLHSKLDVKEYNFETGETASEFMKRIDK